MNLHERNPTCHVGFGGVGLKRIRFWIRPVTICTLIGLIIGIISTPKNMVSNGQVFYSVPFGQWIGNVAVVVLVWVVIGVMLEVIFRLIRRRKR